MAWHTAKDPLRRKAYFLKGIQQPNWWLGSVVHGSIQRRILPEISSGRWPDADHVVAWAQDLTRRQFHFSQAACYLTTSKRDAGDHYCVLAPHYFRRAVELDILQNTSVSVSTALQNLLSSQQMKQFLVGRQCYRSEYRLQFNVEGTTIRAVPDLLMLSGDEGGLDVVDWKVAATASSYHYQVAVYALAARETSWLASYARPGLTGYVVNLLEPDPAVALRDPFTVDERILETTVDTIYESTERIRALIGDKRYNQLDIGRFEYASSPGTCALCNWRELCMELGDGSPAESLPDIKFEPTQLKLPLG